MSRFAASAVAGVGIVAALGTLAFGTVGALAVAAGVAFFVIAALVAGWQLRRRAPYPRLGWANLVTLLRLALVSTLVIPLAGATPAPVPTIAVATLSLSLDGVDGWLARRQGLSSSFGARFDMEVDSLFALVLALLAFVGGVGWWVILLGLPRYLFGVAQLALPWLTAPLPPRYSGKMICVIQLIVLIVLQSPWVPTPVAIVLGVGVLGALAWSFGRDIVALWRMKP